MHSILKSRVKLVSWIEQKKKFKILLFTMNYKVKSITGMHKKENIYKLNMFIKARKDENSIHSIIEDLQSLSNITEFNIFTHIISTEHI